MLIYNTFYIRCIYSFDRVKLLQVVCGVVLDMWVSVYTTCFALSLTFEEYESSYFPAISIEYIMEFNVLLNRNHHSRTAMVYFAIWLEYLLEK